MSVTYRKAPLIELVAELRWNPVSADGGESKLPLALPGARAEELFMHLGALMSMDGFGRFERLLPPGIPLPVGQAVCRFRPTDTGAQSPLFQIGPGVFTANALPPYESWGKFRPHVERGAKALFAAFGKMNAPPPKLRAVALRYIDAFSEDLTDGKSLLQFLGDVIGISLQLPNALAEIATKQEEIQAKLELTLPTRLGPLELVLAEGTYQNNRAIFLQQSLIIEREIGGDVEAAVAALTQGRDLLHSLFRKLTAPLHQRMDPA